MVCSKCGKELEDGEGGARVASISGSVMGDEYIDSFYFCSDCEVYTKEAYRDSFSGSDSSSVVGPISKEEGDEKVKLIRECDTPWNKRCRCKAHREYFGSWLD